jgi:8-oxo-dGTP diphosphatase
MLSAQHRYPGDVFDVAVTYLMRHNLGVHEVLLGEKLTGLGIGKVVGPGGKAEPGEDPRDTAVREIREEVGLRVSPADLRSIAVITYPFINRPTLSQRSFVFHTDAFEGSVLASTELAAAWWPVTDIPFDRMWADAKLWLPKALNGIFIEATCVIGEDDTVVSADIRES